ncbi:hypothetical protein [Candidatus Nitrosotenuis uzonensis]|uniref:PEFG-CTERM sorting domain-containing protein n=1 Tax=Candidatus Nitrosotenuis uzonensis TaxID=1407055 RepID=V6ASP7_9ARCH|nr:hypothetical protein [Candidatus Nitrosotenuis uzonensis]CDI05741.1 exported hypothetical protein [Candidatus Nitrosotenuis uzonensis]
MKISFVLIVIITLCTHAAFAQSEEIVQTVRSEMVSSDGTVRIQLESNLPKENTPLIITIKFSNIATGATLHDVNYDIVVMQNGELVLSQMGMYAEDGMAQHVTASLNTDNHVEVMIVLQGIGSQAPYSGPKGEMIEIVIVPEFGPVVFLILFLATIFMLATYKIAGIKVRI